MGKEETNKIKSQMDYIFRQLKNILVDKVTDQYNQTTESVPLIKEILQHRYNNGPDMNIMISLFDTMLLSTEEVKKYHGLYYIPVPIQKWAKKMRKVEVKSSESTVYLSDILDDISVIIKSPKNKYQYSDLIREYYIGFTEINKLRYYVPNFMYTIGAFLYPEQKKKSAFVIYEKIPGDSLEKLIKEQRISFSQFLNIFIQILFALEIGQRNIRFCHFDLHTGNIIIRPISKPFTYTVVLDNTRYDITAVDYIPVIIDFGMATVTNNSRTLGSYYFSQYGMMSYMVQGADMYKLLFYSLLHSRKTNLHQQILNLFTFYGQDDPYKLLTQKPEFIKKVSFEFARKGSLSKVATYIPINFINWIINNPKYNTSSIKTSNRDIFFPLNYSSTIQYFFDVFQNSKDNRIRVIILLEQYSNKSSYVLMQYIKGLLNIYDENVQYNSLRSRVDKINRLMKKNRRKLIHKDKNMLLGYTKIKIPNQVKLQDYMSKILNTRLGYIEDIRDIIKKFFKISKIFNNLNLYLQFLYTIRELHINEQYKTYENFVHKFTKSKQYIFYTNFYNQFQRTIRWVITLLESNT